MSSGYFFPINFWETGAKSQPPGGLLRSVVHWYTGSVHSQILVQFEKETSEVVEPKHPLGVVYSVNQNCKTFLSLNLIVNFPRLELFVRFVESSLIT